MWMALAIFVNLFVINPLVKRKEEQRLEPSRTPILKFWDHHLTMYAISLLMQLDFRQEIKQAISDINSQFMITTDSYADEQKLIDLAGAHLALALKDKRNGATGLGPVSQRELLYELGRLLNKRS